MKRRCFDPKEPSFKYVGGRGLTMCSRWLVFENFLEDMGPKPGPGYSIDRFPNNNDGYHPDNCRWATDSEQQINSRKAVFLEHDGKRLCLSQWERETGIPIGTIRDRIKVFGWSVADALTIKPELGANPIGDRRRAERERGRVVPLGINPATGRLYGVNWNKLRQKWMTRIYLTDKTLHLGYYAKEEDAVAVIQRKVSELREEGLL